MPRVPGYPLANTHCTNCGELLDIDRPKSCSGLCVPCAKLRNKLATNRFRARQREKNKERIAAYWFRHNELLGPFDKDAAITRIAQAAIFKSLTSGGEITKDVEKTLYRPNCQNGRPRLAQDAITQTG